MNDKDKQLNFNVESDKRREALQKLGKYTIAGSAATFALTARGQSTTNCGRNGTTDPSEGAGGNNCNR